MSPNRESIISCTTNSNNVVHHHKSGLSMEKLNLQRTKSDITFHLSKEAAITEQDPSSELATISEVEDAKCECCGMSEECTCEYVSRVRAKYGGKMICGLCADAVSAEMEKNGGKREEALSEHMNACVRFNRFGRTHPVLFQAEAMREILKKNVRGKSISPRDVKKGGIARSSSCIPALTKDLSDINIV